MADKTNKKVLAILGPTGVGKTGTGIKLCKVLKGEIISCDSRQIYKYLDIGTAKPTPTELQSARHHLIDIIEPGEQFSAFRFRNMAEEVIKGLLEDSKQPIVLGGTGLYYQSLSEGLFMTPEHDQKLRDELEQLAESKGNESLWERLNELDPVAAQKISKSDRFRIIRALEIQKTTGKQKTELAKNGVYPPVLYNFITVGLNLPRKILYEKINKRVDLMLEAGWEEETRKLIQNSHLNLGNIKKLMGYNRLYEYIHGEIEYSECVEKIKQAHRNYAKRQLTWFRRVKGIHWLSAADSNHVNKILELFNSQ